MYSYDTKFLGLKKNEKQTNKKESIQFVEKKKKKWMIAGIEPGPEGNRYKDSRIGLTDLHSVWIPTGYKPVSITNKKQHFFLCSDRSQQIFVRFVA